MFCIKRFEIISSLYPKMEPTEFPQFTELPSEVQLGIFEANPETLRRTGRVSRGTRKLTRTSLARHYCHDPIRLREYQAYLMTQPIVVGLYNLYREELKHTCSVYYGVTNRLYLDVSFNVTWNKDDNEVNISFDWSERVDRAKDMITDIDNFRVYVDLTSPFSLDLWSQYQIVSRRPQCVEYSQSHGHDYARDWVLRVLDDIYQLKTSKHVYDVATSFLLLATNAIILRTPTLPREISSSFNVDDTGQFDPDDPDEETTFKHFLEAIDITYQEIRDYFLTLS
jgi:hypothetical protein